MGQEWEIVGGADKGGILVREGENTSSKEVPQRLSTGAKVLEKELRGQRLNYKKISGTGPEEGWVSISLKGKELARKVSKPQQEVRQKIPTSKTERAIKLLRRAIDGADGDTASPCLGMLWEEGNKNQDAIFEAGAFDIIMEAMNVFADKPEVFRLGAGVVGATSLFNERNGTAWGERDIVQCLVDEMKAYPLNAELCDVIISTMGCLCDFVPMNKESVMKQGGYELMLKYMQQDHPDRVDNHWRVWATISAMASNHQDHMQFFVDAGLIEEGIKHMQRNPHAPRLREEVIQVYNCIVPIASHGLAAAGAIEEAKQSMVEEEDRQTQANCCKFLAEMSKYFPGCIPRIKKSGCIELLLQAGFKFPQVGQDTSDLWDVPPKAYSALQNIGVVLSGDPPPEWTAGELAWCLLGTGDEAGEWVKAHIAGRGDQPNCWHVFLESSGEELRNLWYLRLRKSCPKLISE